MLLTYSTLLLPGNVHAQVRHLWAHARKLAEALHRVRNVAVKVTLQNLTRALQIGYLSLEENRHF